MKKFFSYGYVYLILAFMYVPIFILIAFSFTKSSIIGVWTGWTWQNYVTVFTNPEILKTIQNTLILALLASILSTILGTLGAIGIFYQRGIFGKYVKGSSQIPVINAEIVTAVALALFLALIFGTSKSYIGLLIGHMIICTPFVVLSVVPKLKQMDKNMYEAALDLGATPFQALYKVIIPEILPGILSGFMLSITLSLDDYYFTSLLRPASFDTISTFVVNALGKGSNDTKILLPAFRALVTIIFIVIVIVVIVKNIYSNKKMTNKGIKEKK